MAPNDGSQMKRKPKTESLSPDLRNERRIDFEELCEIAGSGPTKTNADVRAGKLPQPEWDGPKFRRWRLGGVLESLAKRPREKPPGTDPVPPDPLKRRKPGTRRNGDNEAGVEA